MSAALTFFGVSQTYTQGEVVVQALDSVHLTVELGEAVAIMGPSGSGKSTLLSLAGGLERPSRGRVLVAGHDLTGLSEDDLATLRRREVGYVFQELNLIPGLTAAENVALPLELDDVPWREARRRAHEALERVGLGQRLDDHPDDLSGGEQQRVAIARAMVGDHRLLLADEPTGALDTITGEAVMRLIRAHCDAGGAAVIVTHDPSHAAWADRVVFMRDGRLTDQAGPVGSPDHLLTSKR